MSAALTSRRGGKQLTTEQVVKAQLKAGEHVHVAGAGGTHCGGSVPRCKGTRAMSEWLSR